MTQLSPLSFNAEKAAQVAFFFLLTARHTQENLTGLQLGRLIYLSERRAYELYGHPLTGDRFLSTPHGPALATCRDLIENKQLVVTPHDDLQNTWNQVVAIATAEQNVTTPLIIAPVCPYHTTEDLFELSRADLSLMKEVWNQARATLSTAELPHDFSRFPEWRQPEGNADEPITLETLFSALFFSPAQAAASLEGLRTWEAIDRAFAQ